MNFEFYCDYNKNWTWQIVSFSGNPIGRSVVTYATKEACIAAIELIKDDLPRSRVFDQKDDRWL